MLLGCHLCKVLLSLYSSASPCPCETIPSRQDDMILLGSAVRHCPVVQHTDRAIHRLLLRRCEGREKLSIRVAHGALPLLAKTRPDEYLMAVQPLIFPYKQYLEDWLAMVVFYAVGLRHPFDAC